MNQEEEYYFELRYKLNITNYNKIFSLEPTINTIEKIKEIYKSIDEYLYEKMRNKFDFLTMEKFNEIKYSFKEYHKLYTFYFNEERKILFENPVNFLNWYKMQKNSCGYCGISHEELQQIVRIRGGNLTLNNKKKRSRGNLEIEKKDPSLGYVFSNCILACPLCNNAKSNLIDDESWIKYFSLPMKKYYNEILTNK